jgi:limonene-1,2-epoxide hydrolase
MSDNERNVLAFIAAWSRLNVEEIVSYFAEDGTYHNMPMQPVRGRPAVKTFIAAFLQNWTETTWDVRTIMSKGDVVVAERMDRTVAAGKRIDLPCCGVFEMENGKIKVWRDYFDMATYTRALAG